MYILPYWNLNLARSLVTENGVSIDLWDITEKNDNKKYKEKNFTFRKLSNDDYSLSIKKLIKDCGLGVHDSRIRPVFWSRGQNYFLIFLSAFMCCASLFSSSPSSMSDQRPLLSMKKTNFYNFFPSKAEEEEACKINNTTYDMTRELVKIRDLYPAPRIDLQNPWQIKKKLTHDEIVVGMLMIPFFEMFEYILRYWNLDVAKSLENGCKVCVDMWDVTE
ncbi:hypothetical protein H5410_051808 [Solanum commersonii]|uniref:Uncharacterized protein n=1 Tax=Solanum commersonii TaxID=4109 RepID=A0A9J5X158_SOLCO|nr:hypothetical protein H5410_051808 [Solanum commersonii]